MNYIRNLSLNFQLKQSFVQWMERREGTLRQGFTMMESNLQFLMVDEPFFLLFHEFHLKNVNRAPAHLKNWKILAIAASNFEGHLQIIYLRTASSGLEKLGSAAILQGIQLALGSIRRNPELSSKLAGAVANKCAANLEAIRHLQQNGVPVLYDLEHFCGTMARMDHIDEFATHLYAVAKFSRSNFAQILGNFKRLVEENVPPALHDRYNQERLALEALFRNLFTKFPTRTFSIRWVNSNHLEKVGARLAEKVHQGAEEGFERHPALANGNEAVVFMATLTTVLSQIMHNNLMKSRIALLANPLEVQEDSIV